MSTFDRKLINDIRDKLIAKEQTVAVAESVTSGQLQVALSMADQAMEFYQGGITAYNIGQKAKHLHIDPIHALSCDCVSQKIAQQLADNVCPMFSSDWGLGITGYASKVPEQGINDLFAYYAISYRGKTMRQGKIDAAAQEDPLEVRFYFTNQLLSFFNQTLK